MFARSLSSFLAAAIASVAVGASAGTLSSATWTAELLGLSPTPLSVNVPVGGSGSSTSSSVSVSLVLPQFQGGAFGSINFVGTYRSLTLGGSQMLTVTPGKAAATKGIPGSAGVKLAPHIANGANASMLTPMTSLIRVPIAFGGTGSTTDLFYLSGSPQYVTVDFYGWFPGMQTFTGLTSKFSPLPDAMATGSFNLTAMGGGSVLLVAPARVSIDGAFAQRRGVVFTTLKLNFVPEPGTALLLGAGGLALFLFRKQRS
jgi:hypothetical protein